MVSIDTGPVIEGVYGWGWEGLWVVGSWYGSAGGMRCSMEGAGVSRVPHPPMMPLVLCAAALAITYLGFTTVRYVTHNFRIRDQEVEVRRDIARLDREHEQLLAVKEYLESDEYVEYVARNTLGLVRPGETLVVVSGTDAPEPAATPEGVAPDAGAEPWWRELFAP